MVFKSQLEFKQIFPKDGWVEHNPEDIWKTTKKTQKTELFFVFSYFLLFFLFFPISSNAHIGLKPTIANAHAVLANSCALNSPSRRSAARANIANSLSSGWPTVVSGLGSLRKNNKNTLKNC